MNCELDIQARLLSELEIAAAWVESGADIVEEFEGGDIDGECREARRLAKRWRKMIACDAIGRAFASGSTG